MRASASAICPCASAIRACAAAMVFIVVATLPSRALCSPKATLITPPSTPTAIVAIAIQWPGVRLFLSFILGSIPACRLA